MVIDLFSICYNEEVIIPYFLKHYKQFVNNLTVYNNESTDSSVQLLENAGVNIINFSTNNQTNEMKLVDIRNNCWKNSKADWVIVCDIDEFVYHPNILNILENTKATQIYPEGYEMMSENLPTTEGQIYNEIKMGYSTDNFDTNIYPGWKNTYSKGCVFKPSEIEPNFGPGSHWCFPQGNFIPEKNSGIKLLHYKYLNREMLIKKYDLYRSRHGDFDKQNGLGNYQEWGAEEINKQFDSWLPICKNVID